MDPEITEIWIPNGILTGTRGGLEWTLISINNYPPSKLWPLRVFVSSPSVENEQDSGIGKRVPT